MLHMRHVNTQGTLAHEDVSTQDTLVRERVIAQHMLPVEHVSAQGTLAREHVGTQATLARRLLLKLLWQGLRIHFECLRFQLLIIFAWHSALDRYHS